MGFLKHVKKRILLALMTFTIVLFVTQTPVVQGLLDSFSENTVEDAISAQEVQVVQGYIVGEPISSTEVLGTNFIGDTIIALADTASEVDSAKMIYIVLPVSYQATYGLKSNPSQIGSFIQLSGYIKGYLDHAAVDNLENITMITPSGGGNSNPLDETYYQTAIGLTGVTLKNTLNDIISGHTQLSYANVWTALMDTDQDPNNPNNVILLYSGESRAKNLNGGDVDDWNREHVWAKSHGDFGTTAGPGTDIHHLRPTDVTVNSSRGNKEFDYGGTPNLECVILVCLTDSDSWEPDDSVKGDVARMLFYMAVRYEGENGEIDLELNESVTNGLQPFHGKLSVLLEWHVLDPVSDFEIRRNNIIYEQYQFNRNPFIDHPEWVGQIWN